MQNVLTNDHAPKHLRARVRSYPHNTLLFYSTFYSTFGLEGFFRELYVSLCAEKPCFFFGRLSKKYLQAA